MILGPGVTLVPFNETNSFSEFPLQLVRANNVAAYVVDTFHQHEIVTDNDLVMAIIDSMEIPEWYGYDFTNVMTHRCIAKPALRHILVLALTPSLLRTFQNMNLIFKFSQVHIFTQSQFEVFIFMAPISPKPKM